MTQHAEHTPFAHTVPAGQGMAQNVGAPPGVPAPGTMAQPAPYGSVTLPFNPAVPPMGYAPSPAPAPAPEPPLNSMSVASVVAAFVASPVGIVLGILAGKQIQRTGERGRGLAIAGTVLGSLFTVVGIAVAVIMLVIVGPVSEAVTQTSAPAAPSVSAPAPSAAPAPARAASPAPQQDTTVAGRAAISKAYADLEQASAALIPKVQAHKGNLNAFRADCKEYLAAVQKFRADLQAAPLSASQRAAVDKQAMPVANRVVDELQTLSSSNDKSKFLDAANNFEKDMTTLAGLNQALLAA